jgi:hypothetical protein
MNRMSKEVQKEATGAQVGKVAPDASGAYARFDL